MKHARFMIAAVALACAVSAAGAIKLCQLDWLNAWKNLGDSKTLAGSSYNYTRGLTGAPGIWAVTSDQGSPGAKHTVSGAATCSNSGSDATSMDNSAPANNSNCWCLMTAPSKGASWVFRRNVGSGAGCGYYCAFSCALCVQDGTDTDCTRSALLTTS